MNLSPARAIAERDKLSLISGVELFSTLLDDDLTYLASRSGYRSVPKGTYLFRSGDTAKQFFIVKSGAVTVTAASEQELARYGQGDVFGDFHFVISGTYNAAARTMEPTELLVFPDDGLSFDRLCDEKPDTASRILLKSISMIESRLHSTRRLIAENAPWIRELRKQVFIDPSTGLWNRSFMDGELPHSLSGTVAAIMVKPDNFKELNDTLGHVIGDEILKGIAALLISYAAKLTKGWAIRLRSNEMCLILPNSSEKEALKAARAFQAGLSGVRPENGPEIPFIMTASVAIGFWPDDDDNWQRLADRTNEIMQQIWKKGGNRITLLREVPS